MNHLTMGTRGRKGSLVTRRGADWQHDTAPAAVRGLNLQVRVEDVDSDTGGFAGWGCVFGVVDSYGTTFQRGCFEAGGLDEGRYPLLAMHSPMLPLGTFTAEERDQGLWLEGDYDKTSTGQDWRARALSGSAPELSVGFVWLDSDPDDDDLITKARLVETSQITLRMAAVPGAQFSEVRDLLEQEAADEPDADAIRRAHALLQLRLLEV